jgi:hypothetical protein
MMAMKRTSKLWVFKHSSHHIVADEKAEGGRVYFHGGAIFIATKGMRLIDYQRD